MVKEGRTSLISSLCLGHSLRWTRDVHFALLRAVPAYCMALFASGRRRGPDFTALNGDNVFWTT